MKIRIELDEATTEEELIIRCRSLDENIQMLQRTIAHVMNGNQKFSFSKGDTEYFLMPEEILFFETAGNVIDVHTTNEVYQTKYKLYELEEMLPTSFMRVSKSAILNVNQIFSLTQSISTCSVRFQGTHKQVFVSRYYYKPLKEKLAQQTARKRGSL